MERKIVCLKPIIQCDRKKQDKWLTVAINVALRAALSYNVSILPKRM